MNGTQELRVPAHVQTSSCSSRQTPGLLNSKNSAARQCLEKARLRQLRQITGLSPFIALPTVWRELDMQPFGHAWLIRAACFWNTLAGAQGFH